MKQPFWILNSVLFILFLFILIFIFFARVNVPKRQSIEPIVISEEKKEAPKIDLDIIYKNDLFNTFQPTRAPEPSEAATVMPAPLPPVMPQVPETPAPKFFDPLPITLTGIILQEDESNNKAIIMDNKTQQQINYKVGDEVEDAQIIRILKNKIILVRSNGQQEILYLRPEDSKEDNPMEKKLDNKEIVKKINDQLYHLDPKKFSKAINNFGEFLEVFELSTAYKEGKSIGSIIGKLEPNSLPIEMGLMPGDIIIKVNDIQTDTNDNIYTIYEKIISLKENDMINVDLLRNNKPLKLNYQLRKILEKPSAKKTKLSEGKVFTDKIEENKIENAKINILKEKYKFAPTIEEIKLREKQNIFKKKK